MSVITATACGPASLRTRRADAAGTFFWMAETLTDLKKILIAIPTRGRWESAFCMSLCRLVQRSGAVQIETIDSALTHVNRERLATIAVKSGHSHILWLDDDMTFPPDALEKLLAHGLPIVGTNCVARPMPEHGLRYHSTSAIDAGKWFKPLLTHKASSGLVKVVGTGFGVLLIDVDVFRRIEQPWFPIEWLPEHKLHQGEDIGFCRKAREAGYQFFVDQDLSKSIRHVGSFPFGHDDLPGRENLARMVYSKP